MKAQITPGPWSVNDHGTSKAIESVSDSSGRWLADCTMHNARAIAAVPELIEALQAILAAETREGDDYRIAREEAESLAMQALAKAGVA